MESFESQIASVLERNKRVERDKVWEMSVTRRGFIALLTYAATALLFLINDLPIPFLQALVPAAAYILSTLSLPWLKRQWLKFF